MTAQGIDVSHYQGAIDWQQVKAAGVEFAFIKAGQGKTITDSKFYEYWQASKTAGVPRGAYFFFAPDAGGAVQAQRFHSIVSSSGIGWDLPPVVDIETLPGTDLSWFIKNKSRIPGQFLECLHETEKLFGIKPIVYTAAWFWNPVMMPAQMWYDDYYLWVADYAHTQPNMPIGWKNWLFWQYTDKGTINGIPGRADRDHFNGTSAQLQQYIATKVAPIGLDEDPPLPKMARVVFNKVNIYSSPQIVPNNDVGDLIQGARPMIYELKTVGNDKWARISGDLWVAMKIQGAQQLSWE